MDLAKIPVGHAPPHDINVIVEIPQGGEPVKYELDKASGAIFVDRFLHTAMFFPVITALCRTPWPRTATLSMC
jgi:inorganic pyrophosphatase